MARVHPAKFVHVVYRTRRFEQMLRCYQTVFDATVQHQDPVLAFLTYDDEHHRFAFVNLGGRDPALLVRPSRHHGVDVLRRSGWQPDGIPGPDTFGSNDAANPFMAGRRFGTNPIGVEYDPEDWLARLHTGTPQSAFLMRESDLPVSPVRGSISPPA